VIEIDRNPVHHAPGFLVFALSKIPVLVYFLAKLRVVSPHTLLKTWRWAVLGSVVIAAIITPTGNPMQQKMYDIIMMDTGFVVSIPILVLYFSSVLIIWLVRRNEKSRQAGAQIK